MRAFGRLPVGEDSLLLLDYLPFVSHALIVSA